MENKTIGFILEAIEDLEDYIPLLKNQDAYNKVIVSHSVDALRQIFTTYKEHHFYGLHQQRNR